MAKVAGYTRKDGTKVKGYTRGKSKKAGKRSYSSMQKNAMNKSKSRKKRRPKSGAKSYSSAQKNAMNRSKYSRKSNRRIRIKTEGGGYVTAPG